MSGLEKYPWTNKIKNLPFVKEVYFYGLRAKGYNADRYDIEIAVICSEGTTNADWSQVQDIVDNEHTSSKVNLVRFNLLKNGKFQKIDLP
jgi:predicted nucleotidyltransferase